MVCKWQLCDLGSGQGHYSLDVESRCEGLFTTRVLGGGKRLLDPFGCLCSVTGWVETAVDWEYLSAMGWGL